MKSYKVKVDMDQSVRIQELFFELGGVWVDATRAIRTDTFPYLFLNKNGRLSWDDRSREFYGSKKYERIEPEKLIKKLKKRLKKGKRILLRSYDSSDLYDVQDINSYML